MTVRATSTDGSTSDGPSRHPTDVDEVDIGATSDRRYANTVAENAADNTAVGITASDDRRRRHGRHDLLHGHRHRRRSGYFDIGSSDGIVRVDGNGGLRERPVVMQRSPSATSDDGSTSTKDRDRPHRRQRQHDHVFDRQSDRQTANEFDEGTSRQSIPFPITDADLDPQTTTSAPSGWQRCQVISPVQYQIAAYVLTFDNATNYENPADSDTNNADSVTVTINDGSNTGSTISYSITISDCKRQHADIHIIQHYTLSKKTMEGLVLP